MPSCHYKKFCCQISPKDTWASMIGWLKWGSFSKSSNISRKIFVRYRQISPSVVLSIILLLQLKCEKRAIGHISVNFSNIPTQAVWSSFGTSPTSHMAHLSLKACIDPAGHLQSNGFSEVGTLSPGQMPKNFYEM